MTVTAQTWPSTANQRQVIADRLAAVSSSLTTSAMQSFAVRHPWFAVLDAEHRSWVSFVARAGIDSFVEWFRQAGAGVETKEIFDAAPRSLTRFITLHQTVELVRTTIDTVEISIDDLLPSDDHALVHLAIAYFSREVAFDAAAVYAQAAEMRGLWDERLESLLVDAVIRGDADESVVSRAAALGWGDPENVAVLIGSGRESVDQLRVRLLEAGLAVLVAPQGARTVTILGGRLSSPAAVCQLIEPYLDCFGPGPLVVGPLVKSLAEAHLSARPALSGFRAAVGWTQCPRPVEAHELLPERALAGDGHARRSLAHDVFLPIRESGELLVTLDTYFLTGMSIEACARELFVHSNTVRYRLRRIADLTGLHPSDPRDSYVLRLSLTLGRILT